MTSVKSSLLVARIQSIWFGLLYLLIHTLSSTGYEVARWYQTVLIPRWKLGDVKISAHTACPQDWRGFNFSDSSLEMAKGPHIRMSCRCLVIQAWSLTYRYLQHSRSGSFESCVSVEFWEATEDESWRVKTYHVKIVTIRRRVILLF